MVSYTPRICAPRAETALGAGLTALATLVAALLAAALQGGAAFAQGANPDPDGHCAIHPAPPQAFAVFSCWNYEAGGLMNEDLATYPEFLPNLQGWDFRINLPHVRFQRLRSGPGSPVTMAGVVEDPRPLDLPSYLQQPPAAPLEYGHRSNALWLFREEGGTILFSQLPSRRAGNSANVENAFQIHAAWFPVGGAGATGFRTHRIAAAALGRGVGASTMHVVAVDRAGQLWHNSIAVSQPSISVWASPWKALGAATDASPVVAAVAQPRPNNPNAFDYSLALAWVDRARSLRAQFFNPASNAWTAPVTIATGVDGYTPRLVWDGKVLHALYSAGDRVWHAQRLSDAQFSQPSVISPLLPVYRGQFDAAYFNGSVHVVVRTQTGEPANTGVFYTNMKAAGPPATWTIPSDTGLKGNDPPRIAALEDNLFVAAGNSSGRIAYSRKDPNAVDNRITNGSLADRWLEPGRDIDPATQGWIANPELYAFNGDLYMTAIVTNPQLPNGSAQIVNFGRAAMKQLLTVKWPGRLTHGVTADVSTSGFGGAGEARMIGDFNGDNKSDIIRFTQKADDGSSQVHVAGDLWYSGFAPKGEIPLVGNFDGDPSGFDDIITFTQKRQTGPGGAVIGTAPVWVALSNGSSFDPSRVWHTFFSLKGEIPLVGDFNGDGKDDIATFVQKAHRDAAGNVIAQAPVWVALSDGTKYGQSRIWHNFFSLKGEIPMAGDFNGDGKDDIATFVQKPHLDANGAVIAQAPVWVALSDGTKFGQSSIWHKWFAPAGELPRIADTNLDGKDDIVTFVYESIPGTRTRNAYTAYSTGSRFGQSSLYVSDMVRKNDIPFFGSANANTLGQITRRQQDNARFIPDLFIFEPNGNVRVSSGLGSIPYATGAPWERYKWFTQKAIGAAMFPEWIYENGPNHCAAPSHVFALRGAVGQGGAGITILSARIGSRAEHMYEEFGHSLFANCLNAQKDPFGLYQQIYETPMSEGGLDAKNRPGCDRSFDECRDDSPDEHFFLHLLKNYRMRGDTFRSLINTAPDPEVRLRRYQQYMWIKQNWYRGAEFKAGASNDPTLKATHGLLCLPGECQVTAPAAMSQDPANAKSQCIKRCDALFKQCGTNDREKPQVCARLRAACRLTCN